MGHFPSVPKPLRRRNAWVLLGACAAMVAWGLTAPTRDIVLPSEWEACSSAGLAALDEGRVADAERYFLRAIEQSRAFEATDPRKATSLANLAGVRKEQKRVAEAAALYGQSLPALESAGPRYERQLAVVCNDLGTVKAALGELEEAERLIRRAAEINERVRGPDDPEVATNLRNLAAVKLLQGKPGDAAGAATRASAITERNSRARPAAGPTR